MANTRQAAKRARQAIKRQTRNQRGKTITKNIVRTAVEALTKKDAASSKEAYLQAIRALSKAASKGIIPARRASRKIARLTQFAKKQVAEAVAGRAAISK